MLFQYRNGDDPFAVKEIEKLLQTAYTEVRQNDLDASYMTGKAGLIIIYLTVYSVLPKKEYLVKVMELINSVDIIFLDSPLVGSSLYYGRSGVLLALFFTYTLTRDKEILAKINAYSRKIISDARVFKQGLIWHSPYQFVSQPLVSFGQGICGIGYVFEVMGTYFKHPPFIFLAKAAFNYVDRICQESVSSFNIDFRSDISDVENLKQPSSEIGEENTLAPKGKLDFSIENGISGLLFGDQKEKRITALINYLSGPIDFEGKDLVNIAVGSLFVYQEDENCKQALSLFGKCISRYQKSKNTPEHDFSFSLLQSSFTAGIFHSWNIPSLNFKNDKVNNKVAKDLIHFDELIPLLIGKNYAATNSLLSQLQNHSFFTKTPECILSIQSIAREIDMSELTLAQKKVLKNTLEYDENLRKTRVSGSYNPKEFILNYENKKRAIGFMNVGEEELLKKKFIFSNRIGINSVYKDEPKQDNEVRKFQKEEFIWGYDFELGKREISLKFLKIITERFRKPKKVGTALMEVLWYCKKLGKEDRKILEFATRTKENEDLIQRLPFIFLREVRKSIVYGILESTTQPETKNTRFKRIFLQLFLRIKNVSVSKNLWIRNY
ncbi:MAG: lanthionine synthetase LanC family protein [Bacteroidota bacterium]